jgi:hypothetical protein
VVTLPIDLQGCFLVSSVGASNEAGMSMKVENLVSFCFFARSVFFSIASTSCALASEATLQKQYELVNSWTIGR